MGSGGYNPVTKGSLNESVNESVNDKAVYRSAPSRPGLIITQHYEDFRVLS